ncbi:MAG: adenylate/guanylate cyclase domain-containing protein [Chitinophagaceae bacterium]
MASTRQLCAIMFTDIVGYTAQMGRDESRALELLNKNRGIQKPIIDKYGGRWIKELGDGVLASFSTISEAVFAACEIQRTCNAMGEFKLRIGIHQGEVVFEKEDVFGDGVNIASRIQSVAAPGGIFVSESVHQNMANKKELKTQFYGEYKLKNVKDPVRIYQVIADGIVQATPRSSLPGLRRYRILLLTVLGILALSLAGWFLFRRLNGKNHKPVISNNPPVYDDRSIAILPFRDMSPEKDQAYLGDGLAEEIINTISTIRDLRVIGRTTTARYKEKEMDASLIGKELRVSLVLEGSVQKSGNNLRITTQLIRVADNSTLWSERFDKKLKDIFSIQDSIAAKILGKLRMTLSIPERDRLIKKSTDPEAYALYLKGLHTYLNSEYDKSIAYNQEALRLDSLYAPSWAYIALARVWKIYKSNDLTDFSAISGAKEAAQKAITLDPGLAEGYSALALLAWTIELDFTAARNYFEKSIEINPSASLLLNRYGYFLTWMGSFDKAASLAVKAIETDPTDFNGYAILAIIGLYNKNFKQSKKYMEEGQRLFPDNPVFKNQQVWYLFSTHAYDSLIAIVQNIQSDPEAFKTSPFLYPLCIAYLKTGERTKADSVLYLMKKRSELEQESKNFGIARVYAQYGNADSCFLYLERSFTLREREFRLLKIDPLLDPIRKDRRYPDIYHRYGFDRYQP